MVKKTKKLSFEDALGELENLVDRMEQGNLTLEDSLESFERGVVLTRTCQEELKSAEQKVKILVADAQGEELEDFANNE